MPGDGRLEGSQAEGWRGDTPLFTPMVGTISRFSLQKFFSVFGSAWGQCRLAKILAYIVEFVQINREVDGKLFILWSGG